MTESLRDFLDRREAEILKATSELEAELCQIRAARSAIGETASKYGTELGRSAQDDERYTIKQMALKVMQLHGSPMTADEIIKGIEQVFSVEVPRSSLSPQLSRLRQKDELVEYSDSDGTWRLVSSQTFPKMPRPHRGSGTVRLSIGGKEPWQQDR